ncbi:TITAN-like protein isoform X2 [Magnolia sinica]|uniref:TITAN-like protein isoform X2 n=1 Tax=Magnolia sinica TaxID=86752 RepID=UPI002658D1A7|nr:TITAN-like protein isoform X2 [Magnolia sinica]
MKQQQRQKKKASQPFEFCKVCNLNHSQGRGHIYFPSHTRSLSTFLSRFNSKLSDVLFFLKYPSPLRPEHSSLNRIWCVFCDSLIQELHSPFVCGNAIKHLASAEHLKSVRDFFRKYGGGMDRVDSFRVSEADLIKWENCCSSLSAAQSSSEGCVGVSFGPSKDIHHGHSSVNKDTFEKNSNYFFRSSVSNVVLPLQCQTNERLQVSHPEANQVTNVGPVPYDATPFPVGPPRSMDPLGMQITEKTSKNLTVYMGSHSTLIGDSRIGSIASSPSNGGVPRNDSGRGYTQVLQNSTQIPRFGTEEPKANVHSGAPPPWLETNEETDICLGTGKGLHVNSSVSPANQSGKSGKLNPNRVGAAWAEKRKIELEMEKRGEIVPNSCGDDWLPNFGRVWQAGTRKESRKEFETEKQIFFKADSMSDSSIKIEPYISKRMRMDAAECDGVVNGLIEGNANNM